MLSPILAVRNIDKSLDFYLEHLSFKMGWRLTDSDNNPTFAMVHLGEMEIMLRALATVYEDGDTPSMLGTGVQLYIQLDDGTDIQKMYNHAKAANANITRPLAKRDWGESSFIVEDPDGYQFLIAQ